MLIPPQLLRVGSSHETSFAWKYTNFAEILDGSVKSVRTEEYEYSVVLLRVEGVVAGCLTK